MIDDQDTGPLTRYSEAFEAQKMREEMQAAHVALALQAQRIVLALQEWIENHENLSTTPYPAFTWTPATLEISIGNITVWEDQNCRVEDLTVEFCKQEYMKEVAALAILLRDQPKEEPCDS